MRAITIREPGDPEVLDWTEVPDPRPAPGEVLIRVAASAVNRADVLQRQGLYPPPPGASEILGLECSGTIVELGADVTGWQVGDEVCALLAGGGYAELVAVPAAQLLPVPDGVGLVASAALPEVACTVWATVVMNAGLRAGEVLLVHGGAGGIGTHAIQVGKALGATVAVTAGSAERLEQCRRLGADILVNYREQDFVAELRERTGGADVVLDNMGASYVDRNLDALATGGRVVIIGFQGGLVGELNIGKLMGKRASIASTALRPQPVSDKGRIVAAVRENLWPLVERGLVRPIIGQTVPLRDAAEAHRLVERGGAFGKVVLTA
ncbi:NAD(P)H-quinone oxidoreductase [Goodfellowiella coeruleoviolacea]|uniref:NAD(P)H quinone oxidoreductase, PIG3 family n=1 Tax=Goodfellowiella coeruleoviolacea TaxID=334858 RepID=A0AAE3GIC5_9PSEU|nr:NAD(P)H-quinone oxidoreductase [Goodfellowiella coeruleoviolacea]MCP2166693.1 putative NAD(P)H quinone oxidoreductase, PIG3 family [Goodfellowiella coeruleoviolacea]